MVEIVMPDYWTWQRESARVAHRLARIRQYKQQYENGGNEVDYRTYVRNTREQYNRKIEEVRNDPRLPERGRRQLLDELNREYSTTMNEALRDSRAAYAAEVDRLDLLANPAPQRGRTADQVAERRELREDLERVWSRSQESVLEGYSQAVRQGDTLSMEVHEQYGMDYLKDQGLRRKFSEAVAPQREARMSPQQKAAAEQLEELKAQKSKIMLGMAHQHSLAEGDRQSATSGRPVVTRDEALGQMAARGMDTGGR